MANQAGWNQHDCRSTYGIATCHDGVVSIETRNTPGMSTGDSEGGTCSDFDPDKVSTCFERAARETPFAQAWEGSTDSDERRQRTTLVDFKAIRESVKKSMGTEEDPFDGEVPIEKSEKAIS